MKQAKLSEKQLALLKLMGDKRVVISSVKEHGGAYVERDSSPVNVTTLISLVRRGLVDAQKDSYYGWSTTCSHQITQRGLDLLGELK